MQFMFAISDLALTFICQKGHSKTNGRFSAKNIDFWALHFDVSRPLSFCKNRITLLYLEYLEPQ